MILFDLLLAGLRQRNASRKLCLQQHFWKRIGQDWQAKLVTSPSATDWTLQQCALQCQANSRCRQFVRHALPGSDTSRGLCELLDGTCANNGVSGYTMYIC